MATYQGYNVAKWGDTGQLVLSGQYGETILDQASSQQVLQSLGGNLGSLQLDPRTAPGSSGGTAPQIRNLQNFQTFYNQNKQYKEQIQQQEQQSAQRNAAADQLRNAGLQSINDADIDKVLSGMSVQQVIQGKQTSPTNKLPTETIAEWQARIQKAGLIAPVGQQPITQSQGLSPQQLTQQIQQQGVQGGQFSLTGGNLNVGSSGTNVSQLQTLLNKLGAKLNVNGKYGPLTRQAVMDFQRRAGIRVDGIVGPETTAALNKMGGGGIGGGVQGGIGGGVSEGVGTSEIARTEEKDRLEQLKLDLGERPIMGEDSPELTLARKERDATQKEAEAIQAETLALDEEFRKFKGQQGKEVTVAGMQGAITEEQRNFQFRRDALERRATVLETKLSNRNSLVNELMRTQRQNYNDAVSAYDKQFSQAIQLYNLFDKEDDELQRNSKASLEVYSDMFKAQIQAGTIKVGDITGIQKAKMNELENQAGFPLGSTLAVLQTLKPNEKVLYKKMDSSGNFNIVIQNADGSITTKRIKGAGMPEPATPLTRTEQKAYDSYAVEIESYPDKESALSDLQTNRSTIIRS